MSLRGLWWGLPVWMALASAGCWRQADHAQEARSYGQAGDAALSQTGTLPSASIPQGRAAGGQAMGGEGSVGAASLATLQASSPQRYLVRIADVTLETADARRAAERLIAAAKSMGGYVGDSTEEVDPLGVRSVILQLRVPSNRFDDLMRAAEKEGTVLNRHIGTQDVTEEYVDVDAKLRNLRRTEERLLSHLSRTARLSDTLAVERELARVRMEIEQLEGRMRYLKHTIAFSTVSVTCREKARTRPPVPPESYSSGEVASAAARSLVIFARTLWSWVIWVAVWTPVWLPVVLVLYFLARRRRAATPSDSR